MAHYAFINNKNIVVEVIAGRDENEVVNDVSDWEDYYSSQREGLRAVRTSYNTFGNQHKHGGKPFRGNYAGFGFTYDETLDVFLAPKPYPSWVLNEQTFLWEAPKPFPGEGFWVWDESSLDWVVGP